MHSAEASSSHGGPSRPVPGAGWALALLLGINLFNYIDRQILSATLPIIRLDATILSPDDPLALFKLGMLTPAFMVAYMLLSPVFGRLGDSMSRWVLVGIAVILWSLATGGTGLAVGYGSLFFARCLVGVGEAAYGPVAPAMLSDLYPVNHRGRIMAWFYMAIPVGSALGYVIGGLVAGELGWRAAFHVAVIPGLILGGLCFFMRDVRSPNGTPSNNPAQPPVTPETHKSYGDVLRELKGVRSFVLCSAGMTASTFVLGGVSTMVQLYLFEREARFTISDKAITQLEELKTSTGERVVPVAVIEKLKTAGWPTGMNLAEFKGKLLSTLTPDEYTLYSSWVFDSSPAEGSLTNAKIGLYFGAMVVISGIVATLLGGMLGDYLRNRGLKGAYFHVAGWGMIVAFPAYIVMLYVPFPLGWVFMFIAVFFLFFNTGPANTILANVVRSRIRATAFAINILAIHALGDAISPPIIGFIADHSSLHTAFVAISPLVLLSGVFWIWGAKYLDEDTAKAEAAK